MPKVPVRVPARRHRERGASLVEYAGLIVLAALILGGLAAVVPGSLQTGVQHTLCTIFRQGDCGAAPTANGHGTPGSRFGGGLVDGVTSIAAPPDDTRTTLPVRAPLLQKAGKGGGPGRAGDNGGRGGDNSSEHNAIVRDTKRQIQAKMGEYVTGGKVTIDCEKGGTEANCIPGGHKSGDGRAGRADVILTGTDIKTGKPVVYIWEVKPNTAAGRDEAPGQLSRYISQKQAQEGPGTEVRPGFGLPPSSGIPGNGDRVLSSWSEDGDPTRGGGAYRGVRFYGGKKRPKAREKEPQEKPAPKPVPAPECGGQEPIALQSVAACPDPVPPVLPEWPLPIPWPAPAPAPVPVV